ncbi:MAG: response regulator transcription factor [Propionibacteriaceae bacterium]|jgi:DNA-binding NarL/FixJ family response regulator|nr:response regulator transcription factor [Propionibacteriaceae bacterium]
MSPPITVLLVDDQSLMRMGFAMVLKPEPGITVVGEAADGEQALAQIAALRPTIALMDVRMPGLDGITATRLATEQSPHTRIIIMTSFDLDEYAFAALKAGASGFLLKDVGSEDLVAAIRAVAEGDAVISPRVTRRLLDLFAGRLPADQAAVERPDESFNSLTPRERDVALAVAEGLSNAEIAGRLDITDATVKTHVGNILTKLDVRDRVHVIVWAYDHGLVKPSLGAQPPDS